jgi:hypothetical protein
MSAITRVFELYDPKKHSIRARAVGAKVNDQYIDSEVVNKLGLKVGDKVQIVYSKLDTEVQRGA